MLVIFERAVFLSHFTYSPIQKYADYLLLYLSQVSHFLNDFQIAVHFLYLNNEPIDLIKYLPVNFHSCLSIDKNVTFLFLSLDLLLKFFTALMKQSLNLFISYLNAKSLIL